MASPDHQALSEFSNVFNWIEAIKVVSPVIVGIISAFIATNLALNKFKKEKHWEDKRSSYKKVISAFEELQFWAENVRAEHCCELTIHVDSNRSEALREIQRFSQIGSLYFNEKFHITLQNANSRICKLMSECYEESKGHHHDEAAMSIFGFHEAVEVLKVINECLPVLIDQARKEYPKSA